MTTLLLARHGETDWNRELRIQGSSDIELNELAVSRSTLEDVYLALTQTTKDSETFEPGLPKRGRRRR